MQGVSCPLLYRQGMARYEVEAPIGAGYYADVFRVVDRETGTRYAAKVYGPGAARRAAAAREVEALARLAHPRVPALREAFDEGDWRVVVMELVPGPNLRALVEARGPLPIERVRRIGIEACQALGHIGAQGWTYRDLHPKNLHPETPKGTMLLDFDGARPPGWPARPSGRIGYRAPELGAGRGVSAACDVYSLAGCLFFALTGEDADCLERRASSVPRRGLFAVLEACRRAEPAARPTTDDLAALLAAAEVHIRAGEWSANGLSVDRR